MFSLLCIPLSLDIDRCNNTLVYLGIVILFDGRQWRGELFLFPDWFRDILGAANTRAH